VKILYKGHTIEAVLLQNGTEGFEDEIRFVHPMTGQQCEMFDQVFAGWSSQSQEDNQEIDEMKELVRMNSDVVYDMLFDALDVDLESDFFSCTDET
jgi:hypothetical protein